MNIQKINTLTKTYELKISNARQDNKAQVSTPIQNTFSANYSEIPFGAIHNVQPPKKLINVEQEKAKLLRQIDEILQTQPDNYSSEELQLRRLQSAVNLLRANAERLRKLNERIDELYTSTAINNQQKLNALYEIKKEFKRIENSKPSKQAPPKAGDEEIDYKLINRFKTAILEDDFRLDKVYNNYYQDLANIKSIKELSKKYPKIKVPPRPENIIAQKIISTLTRDFYEEFSEQCQISPDAGFTYSDTKIKSIFDEISEKYGFDSDYLYIKAAKPVHMAIVDNYKYAKLHGFSNFHEHRKNSTPQITELDLKLLALNFDDFVLTTVRQQYLENKKSNEISYTFRNTTIPLKTLSNTEYKFGKVPLKPISLIKLAKKILQGQRSYNLFDHEKLISRLEYFANTELGNDDKILEYIMNFNDSNPKDRPNLIRFLQELDKINDGDKTISEGLDTIKHEKIKPLETEKINNEQYQAELERRKLEQEKIATLQKFKSEFDAALDTLYLNDMTDIAALCSKYRPKSLESESAEDARFLISIISDNTNEYSEINKPKTESLITNWDTHKFYEKNDPKNPIYIKAIEIATDSQGKLDINKAGQFITNAEIVQTYPQCLEFVPNPELFRKIIEKKENNTEAVLALCKLNDYELLEEKEKASVIKLMEMFNPKVILDKLILKYLVENEYAKLDTKASLVINDSDTVETAISASVKQELIEKYKFPNCLEYLEAFEKALSKMASAKGSYGIKLTGRNNDANPYKMELKINNHDDRLFSSGNNYYFDIYSPRGLH